MPFKFVPPGKARGMLPRIRRPSNDEGLLDGGNRVAVRGSQQKSKEMKSRKEKNDLNKKNKKKSGKGFSSLLRLPSESDSFPELPGLDEEDRFAQMAARSGGQPETDKLQQGGSRSKATDRASSPYRTPALAIPEGAPAFSEASFESGGGGAYDAGEGAGFGYDDDLEEGSVLSEGSSHYDDGESYYSDDDEGGSRSVFTSVSEASSVPLDPVLARLRGDHKKNATVVAKRGKSTNSRARAADALPGMTDDDLEEAEKRDLLVRLQMLKSKGVMLSKNFTTKTPLHELRIEMGRLELMKQTENSVKNLRRYLLVFVGLLQKAVASRFAPKAIRGKLNGFSDHVLSDLESYNAAFETMAEVHGGVIGLGSTGYPIADIGIIFALQLGTWLFLQSKTGAAPPSEDEIIKNHPDLVRRAAKRILREREEEDPMAYHQFANSVQPNWMMPSTQQQQQQPVFQPNYQMPTDFTGQPGIHTRTNPAKPKAKRYQQPSTFADAEQVLADLGLPPLGPEEPIVLPNPVGSQGSKRVELELTGKSAGALMSEEKPDGGSKNILKLD